MSFRDSGRSVRGHVPVRADALRRQERADRRDADRLPAGRCVAAPRRYGPQAGRVLHPDPLDAAGHVSDGRRGQLPAFLYRHGAGFGADGLSGGVRQVQTLFGRGGCEVHPLRPLCQRADALWNLVLLRDDRDALFRRHGGAHYGFAAADHGHGLLLRGAGVQDFAGPVPPLDRRHLSGRADDGDLLPVGGVERLGGVRADDRADEGLGGR